MPEFHRKYINKINFIEIKNLWGKYNFEWELNDDVNILGGINGSGKTTILRIIDNILYEPHFPHVHEHYDNPDNNHFRRKMKFKEYGTTVKINVDENKQITGSGDQWGIGDGTSSRNRSLVNTFDTPIKSIDKVTETNTPLEIELETLIDGNLYEFNFVKLDSKIQSKTIELYKANKRKEADREERRVRDFFNIIDNFFQKTNKRIQFTEDKNIVFQNGTNQLQTNQLSGGEKQLLIILFQVFLQEERPRVLLLDEPEISLHLSWQFKLIETLRTINPNCQLIIATHSPGIFGEGWEDKFINIETLMST